MPTRLPAPAHRATRGWSCVPTSAARSGPAGRRRADPTAGTRETAVTTTIDPHNTGAQQRTSDADGASLEKVRDLLFGVHLRDYDRKLARLEERLVKETNELREDVKKRLTAI